MSTKRHNVFWMGLLVAGAAIGSGFFIFGRLAGPPIVTINNESASRLTEVVLIGERWKHPVSDIEPGKSISVSPAVGGESGMQISFVSNGKQYSSKQGIYLESSGGYRILVFVRNDKSVEMAYGKHNLL